MPAISMKVNGEAVCGDVEGRTLMVEFIREKLGLTGPTSAVIPASAAPALCW